MSDFEHLDYYAILGVPREATPDEIKRAFRREMSKYHPDRFTRAAPADQEYASQRCRRITEAYSVLSDQPARSSYNLGQLRLQQQRTSSTGRTGTIPTSRTGTIPTSRTGSIPTSRTGSIPTNGSRSPWGPNIQPSPPGPRDHQAELYAMAQSHLEADRLLQALVALRQLQQLNPFYRDAADLLANVENQLQARQPALRRSNRSIVTATAVVCGIAAIVAAIWMFGVAPGNSLNATAPTVAQVAAEDPTASAPTIPAPTPTIPAPTPTIPAPTPTIPAPTPTTAIDRTTLTAANGALILRDDFATGGGWANESRQNWSVGYEDSQYRIKSNPGAGPIWSYRTVTQSDLSISTDIQIRSGSGGLLLRYKDKQNYLAYLINPTDGSYRLEQHRGGSAQVLASGTDSLLVGNRTQLRIEARINGDRILIAVNNFVLDIAESTNTPDGLRFGLVVSGERNGADASFDNIEIRTTP